MPNLDRQLDTLARDLEALDAEEARQELAEVEARIAADNERAARLRLILHVKETWASEITIATPSGGSVVVMPQNGRKPKTRDAILSYIAKDDPAEERVHYVKEIRTHLRTLGIAVSPEAVRQALRRLVADGLLFGGKTTDGVSYYKLPSEAQPGTDQE